jgi:hypothetical protein
LWTGTRSPSTRASTGIFTKYLKQFLRKRLEREVKTLRVRHRVKSSNVGLPGIDNPEVSSKLSDDVRWNLLVRFSNPKAVENAAWDAANLVLEELKTKSFKWKE